MMHFSDNFADTRLAVHGKDSVVRVTGRFRKDNEVKPAAAKEPAARLAG